MNNDAIADFLRTHEASPVGLTPTLPLLEPTSALDEDSDAPTTDIDREVEYPEAEWKPLPVGSASVTGEERPTRFIDGCHAGQPVLCLTVRGTGRPVPLYLAEVGAIVLKSDGRKFEREFVHIERVLSFVADAFPWDEVEAFSAAVQNNPALDLRVLPANDVNPAEFSLFDYEAMRRQAMIRAQAEMEHLERLAFAAGESAPTLVDGPLNRVTGTLPSDAALAVGIVKQQATQYLHPQGMRAMLSLTKDHRTPCFKLNAPRGKQGGSFPVLTWYLRLATGRNLAPNWGYVRVEVPYAQFKSRFQRHDGDFSFIDRLSRWLIDARCRADSYSRMPVSLEPIVRAEDALKPLFTPLSVLVNRLYRQAGLFRGSER